MAKTSIRRISCDLSKGDIQCPAIFKGSCCSLKFGHEGKHEHRYGGTPYQTWTQQISLASAVKALRTSLICRQQNWDQMVVEFPTPCKIEISDVLNCLNLILDNTDEKYNDQDSKLPKTPK